MTSLIYQLMTGISKYNTLEKERKMNKNCLVNLVGRNILIIIICNVT